LSRQPTSERRVQYLPARRSVAETSGFWDNLDEELATTLRYVVDHSYTIRREIEDGAVSRALNQALDAILEEGKSVEEAMAEAQVQAVAGIQKGYAYLAEITPVPPFVVAPPEGQAPAGQEAVTITFAPGLGSLAMQRYRDLARRFHETHPDILVEVKMVDFPINPSDLQSFASVADCFLGYPSLHNQQNRGAILDLGSLLDADPSFTTDDFYSPVLEQFTWQGQLWGLPAEVGPYVIEYNKDLFDAAGLDYPTLDGSTELAEVWTTDDFLALAVALTRGEGEDKQYGFVPEVYEGNALPLILERLGARLIDDSVAPPAFSFDAPATVEAMRWYADLSSVHGVRPVFVTDLAELEEALPFQEREALINEGRAAMWSSIVSESDISHVRSEPNVGVVSLPMVQGGTGSYRSASGYFISAQTEAPQACWQWLTFLTEQPDAVQGLPARRTVAESEAYRQQVGEERAAAYLASVTGLQQPFQIFSEDPWLREALYWLFQAYGQVLEGEASVEAALNTAQRMADDYRACVMAHDAFSHQEGWQACLKEVDPTLPDFLVEVGEEER
jgi:multiple sugar transport system substrate-binding protein